MTGDGWGHGLTTKRGLVPTFSSRCMEKRAFHAVVRLQGPGSGAIYRAKVLRLITIGG
jgi:hypothetical protein